MDMFGLLTASGPELYTWGTSSVNEEATENSRVTLKIHRCNGAREIFPAHAYIQDSNRPHYKPENQLGPENHTPSVLL